MRTGVGYVTATVLFTIIQIVLKFMFTQVKSQLQKRCDLQLLVHHAVMVFFHSVNCNNNNVGFFFDQVI